VVLTVLLSACIDRCMLYNVKASKSLLLGAIKQWLYIYRGTFILLFDIPYVVFVI
jgi:hypothetical protein